MAGLQFIQRTLENHSTAAVISPEDHHHLQRLKAELIARKTYKETIINAVTQSKNPYHKLTILSGIIFHGTLSNERLTENQRDASLVKFSETMPLKLVISATVTGLQLLHNDHRFFALLLEGVQKILSTRDSFTIIHTALKIDAVLTYYQFKQDNLDEKTSAFLSPDIEAYHEITNQFMKIKALKSHINPKSSRLNQILEKKCTFVHQFPHTCKTMIEAHKTYTENLAPDSVYHSVFKEAIDMEGLIILKMSSLAVFMRISNPDHGCNSYSLARSYEMINAMATIRLLETTLEKLSSTLSEIFSQLATEDILGIAADTSGAHKAVANLDKKKKRNHHKRNRKTKKRLENAGVPMAARISQGYTESETRDSIETVAATAPLKGIDTKTTQGFMLSAATCAGHGGGDLLDDETIPEDACEGIDHQNIPSAALDHQAAAIPFEAARPASPLPARVTTPLNDLITEISNGQIILNQIDTIKKMERLLPNSDLKRHKHQIRIFFTDLANEQHCIFFHNAHGAQLTKKWPAWRCAAKQILQGCKF